MRRALLLLVVAASVACGSVASGVAIDAGPPERDAGLASDAGLALDAGIAGDAGFAADAGFSRDAGLAGDAGFGGDAGFAADAGVVPLPDAGPPPPRPTGPFPENGWSSPTAHNGRVLPWELSRVNEDVLLNAGRAALYAVGGDATDHHREREPVIFVHGITGQPDHFQPFVDRFWASPRYQLYVLAYNDFNRRTSENGEDLALDLRALAMHLGRAAPLSFVAHSMGGIVVRWALDRLSASAAGQGADLFGVVRVFGVDNPWHGYDGPADGPLMDAVRPFMPDGLEDMRALSGIFVGDMMSADPVLRLGLARAPLAPSIHVFPVFAQNGDTVLDYTEGVNAALPERIANAYLNGNALLGEPKQQNFWEALRSSAPFAAFDAELRAWGGRLNAAHVTDALLRHYPRFPGEHTSVLNEHPGERSWLDHMTEVLAR